MALEHTYIYIYIHRCLISNCFYGPRYVRYAISTYRSMYIYIYLGSRAVDGTRARCCGWAQDSWTLPVSEVKDDINTVQFLTQTDCFISMYCQESQGLIWICLCMFFYSQRFCAHWLPLNDWQTATVWVKNLRLCSTEEIKSPTSWMPWGKQINIKFTFLGELSL